MIIYKYYILKYVSSLTPDMVFEFSKKQQVFMTKEESIIVCHFIQNNAESLLEDNSTILSLKHFIRNDLFQTIYDYYLEMKKRLL